MRPRRALLTASLLLLLTDVAVRLSSAGHTLCINADNFIDKLYINGEDMTSRLVNGRVARACDCIQLPVNTRTIAVQASNLKGDAGLQACRTESVVSYDGWRCVDTKKVTGSEWHKVGYNDKWWKSARFYNWPNKHLCKRWSHLPCQTGRKWFWARRPLSSVVCRTEYCEDNCAGCQSAGPGQCDPGKCTLGAGIYSPAVAKPACQRKCHLDVKAWADKSPANGYIKVTDVTSSTVDVLKASVAGRYLATVDMATCTLHRLGYSDWSNAALMTLQLNNLNDASLSPESVKLIAIDLAVGGTAPASYAPWIDLWVLGVGDVNSRYGSASSSTSFRALLQGVNNGQVDFTNIVGPS